MYPVSADFHNLSIADAPTSRVRIYFIEANVDCTDDNDVQSNGTLLCMPGETDSNGRIEKGGVTINEFFNSDANVQIGATVSSQIGMTLINRDGALDGFNYGRCKLYIDVYDDTNSTWLTCPMGVYNIAIPKRRKVQLVSATGYDQMQQLDEIADSWWNGLDWSNGITLLQIIQSMAATLGIHLSANTSANIVNSGLSYTEIPFTSIEMTYRDVLSYIAETTGTIARFDRNGALDLRWFSDAVLSTDTQTYAGGLVTFTATDRASISSLSVPFSPIQDLHGYANPWPGGGGKNAMPSGEAGTKESKGITVTSDGHGHYTVSGTSSSAVEILFDLETEFTIPTSDTHSLFFMNDIGVSGVTFYFRNGSTNIDSFGLSTANKSSASYVTIGGKVCNRVRFYISPNTAIPGTMHLSPMIVTKDVAGNSFIPYSNICPISGRTGVSAYRTGVNVWDEQYFVSSNRIQSNYIPVLPNTTYNRVSPNNIIPLYYDADKNQLSTGIWGTGVFTTPADCYYLRFQVDPVYGVTYNHDISINYPSTDTDYHAYQGQTISVDWTSEAGTVYGGTLDVVTGVLTVDRAIVDMTAFAGIWNIDRPVQRIYIFLNVAKAPSTQPANILCNRFETRSFDDIYAGKLQGVALSSGNALQFHINGLTDDAVVTTAMVDQYFVDNPTQVVYELATPITYQLTAEEVEALVGTNNVWSTGDSVSVTVSEPTLVEIQTDTVGNQCLSIDVGEYQVSQIDALSVKASQADVGVTIGSGGNAYTILDNPMLFGDEAAITTKATPIYNRLSAFRLFTPISMRCIMDWSIEAGDIITVTNESVTYDLPVFQQRLRWRGGYVVSDLFSSGEQERPTQSKEIRSSFRSNTQLHEFEVTLEQLRSYIQSVDGNYTLIQQTVDAITQTVANQNVTIQNILDPTGEIWTAITKNTSNLSSIEDSLNNEITERKSYIRFIPSEPAIVMGVDEDNEIKLKLVNNIIYFFNGADDSTDLSLAYAYFNSQEAFADRFVAGESVQIGTNDNAAHWLWKKLNNGDLVLELVG